MFASTAGSKHWVYAAYIIIFSTLWKVAPNRDLLVEFVPLKILKAFLKQVNVVAAI